MNPMLKIAYNLGCRKAVQDLGLTKQAAGLGSFADMVESWNSLPYSVQSALAGGATGSVLGGTLPYVTTNGPFWNKDERATHGALVGGLAGILGGGIGGHIGRHVGDWSGEAAGALGGILASGNYDYGFGGRS